MSVGAELSGIDVKFAIENDSSAAQTFRKNHPNVKLIRQNICDVDPESFIGKNKLFVIFGGPPCQGFSTSNTITRTLSNKNNLLFKEFIRFVRVLQPRWFVFENVEGFQRFQKGLIKDVLKQELEDAGYTTTWTILEASDYGVPQSRKRFFMVGNNANIHFEFPKPNKNKVTVDEAIRDLPDLENGMSVEILPYKEPATNKYLRFIRNNSRYSTQNFVSRNKQYVIERYKYIKPGQNWESIPKRLMKNYSQIDNTHSGIYRRLNPDLPSVVISNYRKNMLIHPYEHRGLSVREAARLQSFPDTFYFHGPLMHIQQQIGNAVPPLLAKAIFSKIIKDDDASSKKK